MKIAVLGATGRTGQVIVEQALAAGHHVAALVRRPEGLPVRGENLEVVVGDARDPAIIEKLAAEIDDSASVDVCLVSTRLLFDALPRHGKRRIVLMSTHGAGGSNDGSPYVTWLRDLVKNRVLDKDHTEEFIAASDAPVDWTVIRNPSIYEGELGRPHEVYTRIELDRSSRVTYQDLAAFALSEVVTPRHVGQFLTITEPLEDTSLLAAAEIAPEVAA
jgi:uncharacterized protein YbjT (DUF2867 family)